ncbi:MAG: prepilin-type N-terminal cleavage/methylation domain-containing protein, partial [Deltaproteobacteria bacterium]|nr:prepilin-type N-terminal cleavage/methylation domain-containing protein [Deltaproteobacteria bacterium]
MNTPNSIRDNETGFTILEVVIAISILSIGLLAVAS